MQAEEEIHLRKIALELTPERYKLLTYIITRDIDQAERAEAQLWLQKDRQEVLSKMAREGRK